MMNQYHSPCSAIATIALLSFCFAAPVRAGYALYSARQIQSEEPLDGGLYTYTGIAIALDVNCHPIGMQQACPPSLLHIQIYPSRMVFVNPAIGFPQAAPFAGNVKLDGIRYRKYQIGDGTIALVDDDGEIVNYGRLQNGLLVAVPLKRGNVLSAFSGVGSGQSVAASDFNQFCAAAWNPSVSAGQFFNAAMQTGNFNPLNMMVLPGGLPDEMYKLAMMEQMYPVHVGGGGGNGDGDEKIRQIEDSMHDRELRRIERNSPSGASRYGTSPTGTTVTWDPSAAAGTGTLLVPWSGNQGLF